MKEQKNILETKNIVSSLLKIAHRIPAIINGVSHIKKLRDEEKSSWGKLIEHNAVQHKDRIALKFENNFYTYFELNEIINRYANYFFDQGITKGGKAIEGEIKNREKDF